MTVDVGAVEALSRRVRRGPPPPIEESWARMNPVEAGMLVSDDAKVLRLSLTLVLVLST